MGTKICYAAILTVFFIIPTLGIERISPFFHQNYSYCYFGLAAILLVATVFFYAIGEHIIARIENVFSSFNEVTFPLALALALFNILTLVMEYNFSFLVYSLSCIAFWVVVFNPYVTRLHAIYKS